MEDAAGVVRRIILLWCEVIIPPCPPSLSSSLVYFWLAAVCVCVLFSTHSLHIHKTGKHICHLCFLFIVVKAPKLGHREDICVYVGVAQRECVHVCLDWWSCCVCINSSTLSIKSSPLTSSDTKPSRRSHPALHAEEQHNSKTTTAHPDATQRNRTRGWSGEVPHSCRPQQSEIRCIFVWQDKTEKANILQGSKFYIYSSFFEGSIIHSFMASVSSASWNICLIHTSLHW